MKRTCINARHISSFVFRDFVAPFFFVSSSAAVGRIERNVSSATIGGNWIETNLKTPLTSLEIARPDDTYV